MAHPAPVVVQCVLRVKVLHIIVNSNLWHVGWQNEREPLCIACRDYVRLRCEPPDHLHRQNAHCMARSSDAGKSWTSVVAGKRTSETSCHSRRTSCACSMFCGAAEARVCSQRIGCMYRTSRACSMFRGAAGARVRSQRIGRMDRSRPCCAGSNRWQGGRCLQWEPE